MISHKVEQEVEAILAKDELIGKIVSLADPSTVVSGPEVENFLRNRPLFQETYRAVLKDFSPIVADDFLSEYQEEEGEHLITYLGEGREALEKEIGFLEIDHTVDLWTYWKRNMYIDETLKPEEYKNAKDKQPLRDKLISSQEKRWALYGAFAWGLARGKPGESINCLGYIARIEGKDIDLVIKQFEPVLTSMRKLVENLHRDYKTKPATGLGDTLGGSSPLDYLEQMDQAMRKLGYYFGDEGIESIPIPVA